MKKRLLQTRIAIAKKWALVLLLMGLVALPEKLLHTLLVLLHKLYEAVTSVLEELLVYSFDLSKFYSQLIVFYLSLGLGLWVLYWLWKRLLQQCALVKAQTLQAWQRLPFDPKIKLLMLQLLSLIGAYVLLLA